MAIQIVFVLAETYGLRIYAIMLPSSDFLDAHFVIHKIVRRETDMVRFDWLLFT